MECFPLPPIMHCWIHKHPMAIPDYSHLRRGGGRRCDGKPCINNVQIEVRRGYFFFFTVVRKKKLKYKGGVQAISEPVALSYMDKAQVHTVKSFSRQKLLCHRLNMGKSPR